MKSIITTVVLLLTLAVSGQSVGHFNLRERYISDTSIIRDTIRIHDTTFVPFYIYQITDTIACSYLITEGKRVKLIPAFALLKGFKTAKGNQLVWIEQPQLAGILDERKRPVLKKGKILQ